MTTQGPSRNAVLFQELRLGSLAALLSDGPLLDVADERADEIVEDASRQTVVAAHRLQHIGNYRDALQRWFRALRVGGHLVVTVPHAFLYERQLALPSRWHPNQRRLYTPASLLAEVEEALEPNSYRVRWLGDRDTGYDYARDRALKPVGAAEVVLVVERIEQPAWTLADPSEAIATTPDFAFVPNVTRSEHVALMPHRRVLLLKLDHLGDFIMGLPALERARAAFADAEITLVVGSWNAAMARECGLADHVLVFDAFPRNSSEEAPDIRGTRAAFEAAIGGDYDIAIDLRTDMDSRFLLRSVRAGIRAGIGSKAECPYLDIFLPVDSIRHEHETARDDLIASRMFQAQSGTTRSDYRVACPADKVNDRSAIIWGPYFRLRPGRYIFEPFVEFDPAGDGLLMYDIALDKERVTELVAPLPADEEGRPTPARMAFVVDQPQTEFEFRIYMPHGAPTASFSFFGGRLMRQGAGSVLHQSEYLILLIELVAMRVGRFGVLQGEQGVA